MKVDSNKLSIVLISVGTALIIAAIALFVVWWQAYSDSRGNSDLETVVGFGEIPTPVASVEPERTPVSDAPIARLVVPSQGIDAPVVVKGVDAAGVMESPDNAYDTAWYDFSARPGFGGNAVFSGHVDYVNVGKAVFWNLKDLAPGDVIEVHLTDGTVFRYGVTVLRQYDAATAPVEEIVGPTPKDSVTLITCSGTFSRASGQYDKRLVVRAEILDDGAPALPEGPA